jgi:hypothetical protein
MKGFLLSLVLVLGLCSLAANGQTAVETNSTVSPYGHGVGG